MLMMELVDGRGPRFTVAQRLAAGSGGQRDWHVPWQSMTPWFSLHDNEHCRQVVHLRPHKPAHRVVATRCKEMMLSDGVCPKPKAHPSGSGEQMLTRIKLNPCAPELRTA